MDNLSRTAPAKVTETSSGREKIGHIHDFLKPGNYLSLRVGSEILTGVVDAVMPDKSWFWIWADGGMGRRMIDAGGSCIHLR